MNENQETFKLKHGKYNANVSKRKPQRIKNYLSDTISSRNKKQFKYVQPSTPLSQSRTKITTFHLDPPEKHSPGSKSVYKREKATETYDPYGHFTTITDFGNDPYNHFS